MSDPSAEAPTGPVQVTEPRHFHFEKPARLFRKLSVPIILIWIAIAAFLNISVPQLETVGEERSVSMSPDEAPAVIAMQRAGLVFDEYKSNSSVMIVLEGEEPLGDDARQYYSEIIRKMQADPTHVEHVQDLWSDPLTASGVQSNDGKAVYVQANIAGNQGESLANESVQAVRDIIDSTPAPEGVSTYITGAAALSADQQEASHNSLRMVEALTFGVIILMLLIIYRSIITTVLMLVMVVHAAGMLTGDASVTRSFPPYQTGVEPAPAVYFVARAQSAALYAPVAVLAVTHMRRSPALPCAHRSPTS